jgi:hypothetical protein
MDGCLDTSQYSNKAAGKISGYWGSTRKRTIRGRIDNDEERKEGRKEEGEKAVSTYMSDNLRRLFPMFISYSNSDVHTAFCNFK